MELLAGIGFFVAAVCIVEGIIFIFRNRWDPQSLTVEKRLEKFSSRMTTDTSGSIIKKKYFSGIPGLDALFAKMPVMHRLNRLLIQADSKVPPSIYVLITLVLALSGYVSVSVFTQSSAASLAVGLAVAVIPCLYLFRKRKRRMKKFQEQLPDALDLLARSLRAGHAFSGGLNLVAQEFDEPIGAEFLHVVSEINLGASIDQALRNMVERVDVPDLKFFTVSVIVQKESGGNLGDILENISRIIRERFKMAGRIRALSAEGKLTAGILIALPVFIVLVLSFLNPAYIRVLIDDAMGRALIMGALFMLGIGVVFIKKLINIKV